MLRFGTKTKMFNEYGQILIVYMYIEILPDYFHSTMSTYYLTITYFQIPVQWT